MAPQDVTSHPMMARLVQAVGTENVLTSAEDRAFYSHDVYRQMATPLAVVRPGSIEELARIVGMATAEGIAIVPRGGGASSSSSASRRIRCGRSDAYCAGGSLFFSSW